MHIVSSQIIARSKNHAHVLEVCMGTDIICTILYVLQCHTSKQGCTMIPIIIPKYTTLHTFLDLTGHSICCIHMQ